MSISLSDVGKTITIRGPGRFADKDITVEVQMVIRAPRGQMALFTPEALIYKGRHADYLYMPYDKQAEAIRAFMEQHSV